MTDKNNQASIMGSVTLSAGVSEEFNSFMEMLCKNTGTPMTQHIRAALLMYANWMSGERGVYD